METQKKGVMDRITDLAQKLANPLGRFANTDAISSIVGGLIAITPIIMIGAIFLIVYVLGSPSVGTTGKALIPFLAPVADKFSWLNNITLGLMSLYASVAITYNYAQKKKINPLSGALLGLATFIIFTVNGYDKAGGILVSSLGSAGLFVCMITSLVGVRIYKVFIDHNITIKMPDSVPANVGNAFGSLFPYAAVFTLAWLVRTAFNFDSVKFLNTFLQPILNASDSLWFTIIISFLVLLFWSIGLHGDNMILSLLTPAGLVWLDQNTKALQAGTAAGNLPHVLAGLGSTGLFRLTMWTSAIWPLIVYMLLSKRKEHKILGTTALAPGIFTIIEPVIYGLPVALNPYLIIPFLLTGTLSTSIGYVIMSAPWMGKFYALVPWATPPFILGPLGTGDWKTIFIVILSFVLGLIIYFPFWRAYLKSLEARDKEIEAAKATE